MIRDAAHWDRLGKESKQPADKQMPWMKFFEPRPGSTILELGCHKGANLLKWAEDGHVCHGTDPSKFCIDIYYQNQIDQNLEGNYRGSAELGFAEQYRNYGDLWDHVVLASVLESVDDPVPLLKAVQRSLKPDGEAYITTLIRWYDGKGPNDTQARFYNWDQLTDAIEKVGLYVHRMENAGPSARKGNYYIICWARQNRRHEDVYLRRREEDWPS